VNENWIDVSALRTRLSGFFADQKTQIGTFGSRVNQVFEAFVFAQVVAWYKDAKWSVAIVNPSDDSGKSVPLRLKFSTRGRPDNYSYAECRKRNDEVQVRHQLRVATRSHKADQLPPANICLDVAVIRPVDLSNHRSNDFVNNVDLVSFGEAKHMSAFAELVAGFIGLVHEMQPERLKKVRGGRGKKIFPEHPAPFLFVSGHLWRTARGVAKTIHRRGYEIDIYTRAKALATGLRLSEDAAD